MDYIKEAFTRMNLRQLQHFLLYGTDDFEHERLSYSEWLKKESDPIHKRLELMYPIPEEMDKAIVDLSQAFTAYEEVYMEIGMKAGARLIFHLLVEDE